MVATLNVGTVKLNEKNMMFGFNMEGNHEFLLNTLIFISKWSIWKARNKVKYDKILEFFNFITDVQSFKIIPNFWPVKFYIINIIPFILTF
jgi:hypothetical protein